MDWDAFCDAWMYLANLDGLEKNMQIHQDCTIHQDDTYPFTFSPAETDKVYI